ncbi:MAG: hypothetical protein GY851_25110 [bacterium]|nr:hypothetical protein [bacterium]
MKSAYELAMERLNKESGPQKTLTDEQKAAIAEIENKAEAGIAEQRVHYEGKIAAVTTAEELAQLTEEQAASIASIESQRDRKKEAVWGDVG